MLGRRSLGALFVAVAGIDSALARSGLWFDPSQLPTFSGRLDRWVMTPAGETDRGIFIEGSQFLFNPDEGEGVVDRVARGQTLTIWGIRARSGPVITVLAWATGEDSAPQFLQRPRWFISSDGGREPLVARGRVTLPLLNPQGQPMGFLLEGGEAVRLPVARYAELAQRLGAGELVTVEGLGTRRGEQVALDAHRIAFGSGPMTQIDSATP